MEHIYRIQELYDGNIILHAPYTGSNEDNIPEVLYALLRISNGIGETMRNPGTGEEMMIAWIVYPYEIIAAETRFFAATYGLKGVVFANDGAGNPYLIKPDGTITQFNCIDNQETRIANTLFDYFE